MVPTTKLMMGQPQGRSWGNHQPRLTTTVPVKATTEPDLERQPKRVKIHKGVQTNTGHIETPKCKDTKVKESIIHKISLHINLLKTDHTLKINEGEGDFIPNNQ